MRNALTRHASHAATTRCEALVFDRIAAPSTCRRCGARPLRAHFATTFARTHREPSRGRGEDTRENPHARRKAACDKALRHALKIGRARGALAARRAMRCHRSASRRRPTPSARLRRRAHRGGASRRDIDARIAHRHRIARRRASCASVDRVMRRRNALLLASTMSTSDRGPIDARSMAHRWPAAAVERRRSPSLARRITVGRWRTPSHARIADADPCLHLATGPPTHAPTACGHAQISLPPARGLLLTSAVGPAAPAADGRLSISEEETMHRRTTCKRA